MNFGFLFDKVATGENQSYLDWLLSGALYTVGISVSAFILALVAGVLLGAVRTTSGWKKRVADVYFEVARSIPFMAQLFIAYFVLPSLLFPEGVKHINPTVLTVLTGTLSLSVFMSGRICALVYAGLEALPRSQRQAANALGFSQVQTFRLFLLPQALRNIVPALTSEAMNTVKNSAAISTIGLMDLSNQAKSIVDYTAQPYQAFACVMVGYFIINMVVLGLIRLTEKTYSINPA